MLQSVIVSRIFTIYQLAHLIIYELPKIIEQLSSDGLCQVSFQTALVDLFVSMFQWFSHSPYLVGFYGTCNVKSFYPVDVHSKG